MSTKNQSKNTTEEKITALVVRDITDYLLLSVFGFYRNSYHELWASYATLIRLNKNLFSQVKREDKNPTEVKLTIKTCE